MVTGHIGMSPIYTEHHHPCYEPLQKHKVKQNETQLRGRKVILNPSQHSELFSVSLLLLQDTRLCCVG